MRAIVQSNYGPIDGLALREVPRPTLARDDQVLIRVRAASMHADVWHTTVGQPYVLRVMGGGLRRPKQPIPGIDLAGTVEEVGSAVTRFRVGDDVYGEVVSGNQWRNGGAYAECAVANERALLPKPERLSFEEASAVATSGMIALRALRYEGGLREGMRVLVNGAAGGVGVFAVQIAKATDSRITAVDAGEKLDFLRELGADEVVDFRTQDFATDGERYDLILDVASSRSFDECRPVLTPEGRYVLIGHDHYGATGHRWFGSLGTFAKLLMRTPFTKQLPPPAFSVSTDDLRRELHAMVEADHVRPVVDRTFPLEQVREALRYLMSGEACGKIVITI